MKARCFLVIAITTLCMNAGLSQVLRPFSVRYSNTSVRGNIVYVSNNSITSAGIATNEVAPGGTATNNGNVAQYIDVDNPDSVVVPYATSWKYLATNARPGSWETSAFNDAAWSTGTLTSATRDFGYGDNDEDVCIAYGCNSNICYPTNACTKYITTLFRKQFTVTNVTNYSSFTLNLHRDDGAVIYINGVEAARSNMPTGAVSNSTLATADVEGATEDVIITIPASYFVEGTNTMAIEIHQNLATSLDVSFRARLKSNPITVLSYFGAWKYLDTNTRPAGWETTGFNDAAWVSGNAELGYGDADEATVVSFGPTSTNKYVTTYFRKVINIPSVSAYTGFILNIVRDDGAVVYINGVEAVRSNMPTGTIAHTTLAASTISGTGETTPVQYLIPTSAFINGNNTIAVEIHQDAVTSSDISFNMEIQASTDPTFSSSSANLNLTSCSRVMWAGLYWGATQGTDGANTAWITTPTTVKLKTPGDIYYQNVTASVIDYHNNTLVPGLPHTGYRAFADITSLVNGTSPNGTYWLGNIIGPAGIANGAGGWTIVIAYSNTTEIPRNLTVFDGSAIMNGGDPAMYVPITGFVTPPTGPVSCELGAVVYDGDRVSTDEFSFKQNSNPAIGTYTNLTPNANSNLNDMWNSTISYKGVDVTTRNPAHANTLGYDADILVVPNSSNSVLGNNQTSASIRFSSPSENYFIQMVSTSISVYSPTFTVEKTSTDLNGGTLVAGDILRYTLNYNNNGNDTSTNTIVTDRIPSATSFVPGSIRINSVAKTDASADDEAEYDYINNRVVIRIGTGSTSSSGGWIPTSQSGTITFDVYTAVSCSALSCGSPTANSARIDYLGKTSAIAGYDSSGYYSGGCFVHGPITNSITGSCYVPRDTTLINSCPATSILLPQARYAGYTFYNGLPFTAATAYNPNTPITATKAYYAYFNSGAGCSDTVRINVFIISCPDIDDDNDGIPDYVEINDPLALADADSDGRPNWNDTDYTGYVDNNSDGFNDNFDPGADSDNDGIPNFLDKDFPGFVDVNNDGVNDKMDADQDGVPNNLDLDSDNDGIPDVVESFGVDANGDGRIDNYTDTDNDGLSQNVDGSNTGVTGSGLGLGKIDTDGDGVPNFLDLDSDNDGIPDVVEVYGADTNNDGRIDNYVDIDGDGFADAADGDVGNDGVAENAANTLLRTGADTNSDGRCDSWPYKNMDADAKPNPYELDSDGDGITDVREAGFTDTNYDGRIDGSFNSNGWSVTIAGQSSLVLRNSDNSGKANPYDIDSDDDGIPDMIEGQTTAAFQFPLGTDTDGDGIDNRFDNFSGFGGDGIHPVDTEGDGTPDYYDTNADNDGTPDIYEGSDLNGNKYIDDGVALTGLDTDGDGLDNFFDNDNTSAKSTARYFGTGGSLSGDSSPGTIATLQRTAIFGGCATERDWRCIPYALKCNLITFRASLKDDITNLDWTVECDQDVSSYIIERSIDKINFKDVGRVAGVSGRQGFNTIDHVAGEPSGVLYYRLRMVIPGDHISFSNIVAVRRMKAGDAVLTIAPNPVKEYMQVQLNMHTAARVKLEAVDAKGSIVWKHDESLAAGSNTLSYDDVRGLAAGIYFVHVYLLDGMLIKKITVIK